MSIPPLAREPLSFQRTSTRSPLKASAAAAEEAAHRPPPRRAAAAAALTPRARSPSLLGRQFGSMSDPPDRRDSMDPAAMVPIAGSAPHPMRPPPIQARALSPMAAARAESAPLAEAVRLVIALGRSSTPEAALILAAAALAAQTA